MHTAVLSNIFIHVILEDGPYGPKHVVTTCLNKGHTDVVAYKGVLLFIYYNLAQQDASVKN
jgi:hypothetical protein